MRQELRRGHAAIALSILVMAGCAGTTTIASGSADDVDAAAEAVAAAEGVAADEAAEEPADGPAEEPTSDDLATDAPVTDEPASEPAEGATAAGTEGDDAPQTADAPIVQDRLPEGWIEHDVEQLTVAVPNEWATMRHPAEVVPVIAAAEANGAVFDQQSVSFLEELLQYGDAFVAVGDGGDNIQVSRVQGLASFLGDHELRAAEVEAAYALYADDVTFVSEPRRFNGTPGVLVRGRYEVEGQRVHVYQFSTHAGTHIYFVQLNLYTGDDPGLATDLFKNFSLG